MFGTSILVFVCDHRLLLFKSINYVYIWLSLLALSKTAGLFLLLFIFILPYMQPAFRFSILNAVPQIFCSHSKICIQNRRKQMKSDFAITYLHFHVFCCHNHILIIMLFAFSKRIVCCFFFFSMSFLLSFIRWFHKNQPFKCFTVNNLNDFIIDFSICLSDSEDFSNDKPMHNIIINESNLPYFEC